MPDLVRVYYREGYNIVNRKFSSEDELLQYLLEQFKDNQDIVNTIEAYQNGIYGQNELRYRIEDHNIHISF